MGRKYIKQRTSSNFVYPNNSLEEYDVEIVHNINNNSVSGTTTSITASSISSSSITFSFDYTWSLNDAEPFIYTGTSFSLLSVHMMEPNTIYYKPWRLVSSLATGSPPNPNYSGTVTFTVTPSQMGVSSFSNGVYSFEIRMIGKRAIFPICQNVTVSTIPVPSPTPTVTPTLTPTPTSTPNLSPTPTTTPTPTSGQISTIYKSGATINVTDTGYLQYQSYDGYYFEFIGSLGVYTLTACTICDSIIPAPGFSDRAAFTIIQCGTGCSGVPIPSPTPTPSSAANNGYYILVDCQTFQTKYSQLLPVGTFNSGDRVEGSYQYFYVVNGFTPSTPDQSLIFYVTATGQYGCP